MNLASLTMAGHTEDKPFFKLPNQSIGLKASKPKPTLDNCQSNLN
jgi:hypothetical protein